VKAFPCSLGDFLVAELPPKEVIDYTRIHSFQNYID